MEFKEYKLEDLCLKITDGSHFSPKDSVDNNIPMLSVKDMRYYDFDYSNCKHISEEDYKKMIKQDCVPKKDDILVAKDGSYLKEIFVNRIENKKAILSSIAIFRVNKSLILPEYLVYLMKNPIVLNYVKENCVSGSALPRIVLKAFKEIKLKIPSLTIQKKTVAILSGIDRKIEINEKVNKNLFEIIIELYNEKIKNDTDSYFESKALNEFCNIFTGKRNANENDETGNFKFFTCAPEPLKIKTFIYDGPAIIISGNGAYTGRTTFYNGKFDLYQRTYGCSIKDNINKDYIYLIYAIIKSDLEKKLMGGTHGSAIPYIVMDDVSKFKFKYNKEVFDKVSNIIKPMLERIKESEKQNEVLSQLRDTLLPKLMNGKINLENFEV